MQSPLGAFLACASLSQQSVSSINAPPWLDTRPQLHHKPGPSLHPTPWACPLVYKTGILTPALPNPQGGGSGKQYN